MIKPYYKTELGVLYHGDCLEILPQLTEKVDLVLTDPPYGIDLEYDVYKDTEASWFTLMDKIIPELRKIADMVIFPSCQIKRLGWFYEHHPPNWLIAWHKGSPGHVSAIGFNDWEPLIVYGRTKKLSMHDYLSISNTEKMGSYGHPCPKPLRWSTWLINRACPNIGIVLDPFLGSGTIAVACERLDRRWIGIEISEEYCKIAVKRIEAERAQLKLDL